MTLVIDATGADAEEAIDTANVASREHPCRIIVLARRTGRARLDARDPRGRRRRRVRGHRVAALGRAWTTRTPLSLPCCFPMLPIVAWWPAGVPLVHVTHRAWARWRSGASPTPRATSTPRASLRALAAATARRHGPRVDPRHALAGAARLRARAGGRPARDQARIHGDTNQPVDPVVGRVAARALGCEFEATYDDAGDGPQHIVLETPSGEITIYRPDGHNAT